MKWISKKNKKSIILLLIIIISIAALLDIKFEGLLYRLLSLKS